MVSADIANAASAAVGAKAFGNKTTAFLGKMMYYFWPIVFLASALSLWAYAIYICVVYAPTQATVTESLGEGEYTVSYSPQHSNQSFSSTVQGTSYTRGQTITIRYLKKNPQTITTAKPVGIVAIGFACLVLAAIFLFFVHRISKSKGAEDSYNWNFFRALFRFF